MSAPSTAGNAPGNVVTLHCGSRVACPVCGDIATWRVIGNVEHRSCTEHLGAVAEATETDGFQPLALVRIFPRKDDVA